MGWGGVGGAHWVTPIPTYDSRAEAETSPREDRPARLAHTQSRTLHPDTRRCRSPSVCAPCLQCEENGRNKVSSL